MMKLFKKRVWEILSVVCGALLAVFMVVNQAIIPFENEIHAFLKTSDYEMVTVSPEPGKTEQKIERPALKTADEIEEYYRNANEMVQGEGMVLLKNDNRALPLDKDSKVAFALGGSAEIFHASHGPGVRPEVNGGNLIDLKEAIDEVTDMTVNSEVYNFLKSGGGKYKQGIATDREYKVNEVPWSTYSGANLKEAYKGSDAVIAVITRESGEGVDISWRNSDGMDGSYLSLTQNELSILENLAALKRAQYFDRLIVLINSAVTIDCSFIENPNYGVDAAMWIGLPGASGMRAVAKALIGEINPSGKLSDTLLKDNFSNPAAMYWRENEGFSSKYANAADLKLNNSQSYYGVYVEGVYVGYRYYETRYEDYVMKTAGVGEFDYDEVVAYPFGYGESYAKFEYTDFTVDPVKDSSGNVVSYDARVTVKNSDDSPMAGKEVIQLYLQKPYSEYSRKFGIEKPAVELVGFGKTDLLQPGESKTYTVSTSADTKYMSVGCELLRSYDSENAQTYILDEGDYYLTAAHDSHEAINNILAAKGYETDGDAEFAPVILSQDKVDTQVFSTSSAKAHDTPTTLSETAIGTKIQNRLDFMDPNRFSGVTNTASGSGDVVYVSRKNWVETMPAGKTTLSLTSKVAEKYDITSHKTIVEDESIEPQTFGDMSANLTLAMMAGASYDDERWEKLLNQIQLGDMFLMLTNAYGYTNELPSVVKPATDEDDGPYGVSNTNESYSSMSCEGIIASSFSVTVYQKVGEAIAADARSGHDPDQKNLHGLYAPGLNIHRVAFGGRAAEYFSEDSFLSGIAGAEEIIEMQKQYVVAHPKHYIFNDEESNRNGISVWMNEQAAREIYLLPWEYALRSDKGNAHALMTSFNRAGCIWTSASDDLMNKIIRDEWCFDGYTLTDMAGSNGTLYMVYDDGFMNGTDLFLDKGQLKNLTSEMKNSPTFTNSLRTATKRVLYVIANYSAAMDGYSDLTRLNSVMVWWKVLIVLFTVVFAVGFAVSMVMFTLSEIITGKKKKKLSPAGIKAGGDDENADSGTAHRKKPTSDKKK